MTGAASDTEALQAALRLAVRAPSLHNSQPWRWRKRGRVVDLFADRSRQIPATDPQGRDLVISCGAALHHLLVALAAQGWGGRVRRFPDAANPDHLATVTVIPPEAATADDFPADLADAILRRRTDRRRFSLWPVPAELVGEMIEIAGNRGVMLQSITEPQERWRLFKAIVAAAEQQESDPAYTAELAQWSGRADGADDGVPSANVPAPQLAPGRLPMRAFADPALAEIPGHGEPENAALLLLSTVTDNPLDWLRAGEVTSELLLTATRDGLASSPLTQPLEVDDTRAFVRDRVASSKSTYPQILLRIGWLPTGAGELPATRRRPLDEVVERVGSA